MDGVQRYAIGRYFPPTRRVWRHYEWGTVGMRDLGWSMDGSIQAGVAPVAPTKIRYLRVPNNRKPRGLHIPKLGCPP